jgi:peptidoglycan/LPS O-acetylase OafA/YrhL
VLSGFVIRFVTVTRETDASEYWIDRASRIYSVVAPTLALTVLFEGAAFLSNSPVYRSFAQPYVWTQVPGQLLTNMTFTSGYWGYGAAPLSNLPFWC